MPMQDDFPIGCEVELLTELKYGGKIRPVGTRAKVSGYFYNGREDFLRIDWGDIVDSGSSCWLLYRFKRVDNIKLIINNPAFCSCVFPSIISNIVLGKSFLYCRGCKKEIK